jgi:hypothetical protein
VRFTGYLILENCLTCNLGKLHTKCPNMHPDRFKHLSSGKAVPDAKLIEIARDMYRMCGFRGRVGFHAYNEPLMNEARLWRLTDGISSEVPEARYTLWTNGTRWPKKPENLARFEEIHVTDYGIADQPVDREAWRQVVPHVQFQLWRLDDRVTVEPQDSLYPCRRMFTEFIVDYYGNVHLCCYDWRGVGSPGNIHTDSLTDLVKRWQAIRESISGSMMTPEAPEVCRRCAMRCGITRFVPDVAEDAARYARGLP